MSDQPFAATPGRLMAAEVAEQPAVWQRLLTPRRRGGHRRRGR